MDMAELASRTGISVRQLRYVWDHRVLPGLPSTIAGQGIPRTFTAFEAFGIALAARLLDAGLSRKLVQACLKVACDRPLPATSKSHPPLFIAYRAAGGELQIGDGQYLQIQVTRRPGMETGIDTGWRPLAEDGAVPGGYVPAVLVRVELERLAKSVCGNYPTGVE